MARKETGLSNSGSKKLLLAVILLVIIIVLLFALTSNQESANPTGLISFAAGGPSISGITQYWKLDETSGTTAVNSQTGGLNGALVNGPAWRSTSGKIGGALFFDGTNDYVNFGDLDLTGNFSIGFWMNASALPSGWHTILAKPNSYVFEMNGNTLYFRAGDGELSTTYSSTNAWHHVTGVFNNGTMTLYIDGAQAATAAGATMAANNNPLLAGSWDTSMEYYSGMLDEIIIFNKALTASEVTQLYSYTGVTNYTVNVSKSGSGAGVVTGTGINCGTQCTTQATGGTSLTLTAKASTGSSFAGWSGACTGTKTTCVVSTTANVTAIFNDTVAPTRPTGLSGVSVSSSQINISWAASTDAIGVKGYRIYRCDLNNTTCTPSIQIATVTNANYSDINLIANMTYRYSVAAFDAAGNLSTKSAVISTKTQAGQNNSGPLLYWKFNEGSGTMAQDTTAYNRDATLINGAAWNSGVSGGASDYALGLDGVNDYANAGDVDVSPALTISLWMRMNRPPTAANGWATLAVKEWTYGLEVTSQNAYFGIGNGSNWSNQISTPISLGQWIHLVGVYDGANIRLYKNGVLAAGPVGAALANSNKPLLVGSWDSATEYFTGSIDEVQIYNRALSATEVKAIYDGVSPPTVINGICGSEDGQTYPYTATAYATNNFCQSGTPSPNPPAFPQAGNTSNWTCVGSGTGHTDAACSATRETAPNYNTLTVSKTGTGNGTISSVTPAGIINCGSDCTETLARGTQVTLRANTDNNSIFVSWAGCTTSSFITCNITVDSNKTATARFDRDTNSPTVAITSPTSGATVSGTITVSANASDNVAVAGVMFKVDGNQITNGYLSYPYTTQWNTAAVPNGPHTISATAIDPAGNIGTASIPITVNNALPSVAVTVADAISGEPNDAGSFTISRTGATTSALTVYYDVSGSATNGTDYNLLNGTAIIPVNFSSVLVNVLPIDDAVLEGDENVTLTIVIPTLPIPTNYSIGAPSATLSIKDNETLIPSVSLSIGDSNAAEPNDNGSFTVLRSGDTTQSLNVYYTITGSATNGIDYNALSGIAIIQQGAVQQAIPIVVKDDSNTEGNETVTIALSANPAYTILTPAPQTITITDNDVAPPANGELYYVTPSGGGLTNGTSWANAFAGFSDIVWGTAAGQVGPGDTLYIDGSSSSQTYTTTLTINASGLDNNKITIRPGQDAGHNGTVIISGAGINLNGRTNIVIDGSLGAQKNITIQNVDTAIYGGAGKINIGNLNIDNIGIAVSLGGLGNDIHHNNITRVNQATETYAAIKLSAGANVFNSNLIHHNKINVLRGANGYGSDGIDPTSGVSIYDNNFTVTEVGYNLVQNSANEEHIDYLQAGGANYMKVYNNDFLDVGDSAIQLGVWFNWAYESIWIYNNTFRIVTAVDELPEYIRLYNGSTQITAINNLKIINNTFIDNVSADNPGWGCDASPNNGERYCPIRIESYNTQPTGTGNEIRNNIFYNVGHNNNLSPIIKIADSTGTGFRTSFTFSNNDYNTPGGSPVIDFLGTNYSVNSAEWAAIEPTRRLTAPQFMGYAPNGANNNLRPSTNDTTVNGYGANLSTHCSTVPELCYDKSGIARPASGAWDIGAFEATGTMPPADTQAPSVPTGLTAAAVSASQINISWSASTDNVGVTGYNIYRCAGTSCTPTLLTTTSATTYQNTGLASSTTYRFNVSAYDAAGNTSAQSSIASATTQTVSLPGVSDGTILNVTVGTPLDFNLISAGTYKLVGTVSAPNEGANSVYVDIDNNPGADDAAANGRIWDMAVNVAQQDVAWRGTAQNCFLPDCAQYNPKTWVLSTGARRLYINARPGETGTIVTSIQFVKYNALPIVAITTPANGATYPAAPARIDLNATASDDGAVVRVDFNSGTTLLFSDTSAPYSYSWNNVPSGTYTLTATAVDNAGGKKVSSAVTVTVGSTPPVNGVCGSENGQIYPSTATGFATTNFCSQGTPSPNPPAFPQAGNTSNWTCVGSGIGHTDAACSASRLSVGGNIWYVRKGATGANNGTTWNDAWTELNQINFASVARGDTIEIAAGTYTTPMVFTKAASGAQRITLRRTTNPTYTGKVIFDFRGVSGVGGDHWQGVMQINSPYLTIDGVHNSMFEITGSANYPIMLQPGTNAGPLEIKNVRFYGTAINSDGSFIYTRSGSLTIDKSIFDGQIGSEDLIRFHSEGTDANLVITNSVFKGWTAVYTGAQGDPWAHSDLVEGCSQYVGCSDGYPAGYLIFKNNLVDDSGVDTSSRRYRNVVFMTGYTVWRYADISHNVFKHTFQIMQGRWNGGQVINNTYYNTALASGSGITTYRNNIIDTNYDGTSSTETLYRSYSQNSLWTPESYDSLSGGTNNLRGYPKFLNPASILGPDGNAFTADDGFNLTSASIAINAGAATPGITTDIMGNPIVGNPDIGAYEYVAPGGKDPNGAWYVDSSRASSGDGTSWATAWKDTTNIAWPSVQPGDTIYLSGGTTSQNYSAITTAKSGASESARITVKRSTEAGKNGTVNLGCTTNINNNYITLDGSDRDKIVMDCRAGTAIRITGEYFVLNNTKIIGYFNGSGYQNMSVNFAGGVSFGTILNSTFIKSTGEDQIYYEGKSGGHLIVRNSIFQDNISPDSSHRDVINPYQSGGWSFTFTGNMVLHQDDGLLIQNGDSGGTRLNTVTIINNVFNDIELFGIRYGSGSLGAQTTNIYNNTFNNIRNAGGGDGSIDMALANGTVNRANNIIGSGGVFKRDSGTTVSPTNFINTSNPIGADAIPFTADDGFNIQSGSAAINAGTNLSAIFTTDITGKTRPASGSWDLGAYEYQ